MLDKIFDNVCSHWDSRVQAAIEDFVRIPALSINFDENWEKNGVLSDALKFAQQWAETLDFEGITFETLKADGMPPCLFADIPGTGSKADGKTVFLYGHLDKQPPNVGWDENKSAWEPVVENGRLYGRGAADDGYSWFCSLAAVKALDELGIDRPRCVALFETAEESGSEHYEAYLESVKDRLGDVGLVLVLDSSCGDYDRLWLTQSLRGFVLGELEVGVLEHGVHSGEAGGLVPSSFMIARQLLDRIEDSRNGKVIGGAFNTDIPEAVVEQTRDVVNVLGNGLNDAYPWRGGTSSLNADPLENMLSRNWKPSLSVIGCSGIPDCQSAGNVLRPYTTLKLSMRIPPTVNAENAIEALGKVLTENAPFGADVKFRPQSAGNGFFAPLPPAWLEKAYRESSNKFWNADPAYMGIGASIPLLGYFAETWPGAAFMVSGVLGPESNAHGPNEFLELTFAKRLTASVADVIGSMPTE